MNAFMSWLVVLCYKCPFYTEPERFSDRSKTLLKQSRFSTGPYKIQLLLSRKRKKHVEPTAVLTDVLQVTSPDRKICCKKIPKLRLRGLQIRGAKIHSTMWPQDFMAASLKCMHETVYIHSLFIRLFWNMLLEEE